MHEATRIIVQNVFIDEKYNIKDRADDSQCVQNRLQKSGMQAQE